MPERYVRQAFRSASQEPISSRETEKLLINQGGDLPDVGPVNRLTRTAGSWGPSDARLICRTVRDASCTFCDRRRTKRVRRPQAQPGRAGSRGSCSGSWPCSCCGTRRAASWRCSPRSRHARHGRVIRKRPQPVQVVAFFQAPDCRPISSRHSKLKWYWLVVSISFSSASLSRIFR